MRNLRHRLAGVGKLEGTFKRDNVNLQVGTSEASLASYGSNHHAVTLVDVNGNEHDSLRRMHDTPNAVCDILSECVEKRAGTEITASTAKGHIWVKADGTVLKLHTTPNLLGWLRIKPITDPDRLQQLLDANSATMKEFATHSAALQCQHIKRVQASGAPTRDTPPPAVSYTVRTTASPELSARQQP